MSAVRGKSEWLVRQLLAECGHGIPECASAGIYGVSVLGIPTSGGRSVTRNLRLMRGPQRGCCHRSDGTAADTPHATVVRPKPLVQSSSPFARVAPPAAKRDVGSIDKQEIVDDVLPSREAFSRAGEIGIEVAPAIDAGQITANDRKRQLTRDVPLRRSADEKFGADGHRRASMSPAAWS